MIDFTSIHKKYGKYNSYTLEDIKKTDSVILSNGLTLDNTIKKELKTIHKSAYEQLINRYNNDVLSILSNEELKRYTYLKSLIKEYKSLRRKITYNTLVFHRRKDVPEENYVKLKNFKNIEEVRSALKRRDELEAELLDYKEYNNLSKKLTSSKQFKDLHLYNGILIDCLGSVYNISDFLMAHTKGYYKNPGSLGSEFFANCFAAKVLKEHQLIENTKKYMPKSYMMFEELLQTLYS